MPSIAPSSPDDVDVYLVLDDFGERLGQYSSPVRVIAFNTAEGWSRDVSEELVDEIADRCAIEGLDVPPTVEGFIDQHGSRWPAQLPLPLRGAAS
jgi:hypothetical protein